MRLNEIKDNARRFDKKRVRVGRGIGSGCRQDRLAAAVKGQKVP